MFPCLVEIECLQKFNWETRKEKGGEGGRGKGEGLKTGAASFFGKFCLWALAN
jgi:hypothetical protein